MKTKPGGRLARGLVAAGVASVLATTPALALTKEEKRLLSCQDVMEELLAGKESIPRDLLDKAECVAVVKQDKKANKKIYGEDIDPEKLLLRAGYRVPPTALGLVELLRGVSPRKPLPDED